MDQLLQPAPVAPIAPPSALPAKSNKMLLWISGLVILAVIAGVAIMYWGRTGLFKGTVPPSCRSLDSRHCEYERPDCRWVIDYDGEGSDVCQALSGVTTPAEAPGEPPPPPPPVCSSIYERTTCDVRSDCSWSFDAPIGCREGSPIPAAEPVVPAAPLPAFDFTIESVTDQLVEPSNPTTTAVITARQVPGSGSPQAVSFSTSGFPMGVTTSFSSPSCTPNPSCTTTLTITGSASASVGDHTVSVSGTSGTIPPRNTNFNLIVEGGSWDSIPPPPEEPPPASGDGGDEEIVVPGGDAPPAEDIPPADTSVFNFTLSNDGPKTVARGGMTSEIISVNLISGVTQPVTFAVGGLPPGASITFSPTSCSPTCRTTLTVRTNADTPSGDHNLIVTATAGGETRRTNFALSVTNPSSGGGAPLSGADSLNSEIASLRQQLADSLRNRDVGVTSSLMSQISALQSQINDMRNQPVVVNIPGTTTSASSRIVVTNTAPTAPVPTPNANVSGTVAISASTPSSSQASAASRTRGAFIRGQTGPEMLLYPFLIALANGAYFLIKKRK